MERASFWQMNPDKRDPLIGEYQTYIPEEWRELRRRERAVAREEKRQVIAEERIRTEKLTRALRVAWTVVATIGKVLFGTLVVVVGVLGGTGRKPRRRR